MSTSMPHGKTPQMKQFEEISKAYQAAVPRELASAANLMAHPVAGFAAAGALGIGFASQAFGLWLGTVAGAAEASRKMLEGVVEPLAEPKPQSKPKQEATRLTLVEKAPEPAPAPAEIPAAAPDIAVAEAPVAKVEPAPVEEAMPAETPAEASPKPVAAAAAPDDLKAISGIGPKLEKVLNDLGVSTYAQIAAFTEADIASLDDSLGFSGRIGRDDWVGQAKALVGRD